jgi:alpha-tubulin suppressor-like RCC1 family protein
MPATTAMTAAAATDSVSGGVLYFFQLATDSNFTQAVQSSGWQSGIGYAPPLAPGTTYFWRVKARDAALNETSYTSAWSFNTAGYPATPTMLSPLTFTNSIQWNFTDLAANETGFTLHDPAQVVKATVTGENFSSITESGLAPNTPYTRHIHAINGAGESIASAEMTRYTLSLPPDIQFDRNKEVWVNNNIINFTNKPGTVFGAGGVAYYRIAITQNPDYSFSDGETQWGYGNQGMYGSQGTNNWLHFKSFNGDNIPNGTQTYGPFFIDTVAPTGLAAETPVNGSFNQSQNTPLKCIAASDTLSGSVQYSFQLATNSGFTQGVQSSGWQDGISFSPTSLAVATTYYWRVKAKDAAGNVTAYTPVWSFTTVATWTTKADFEANMHTVGSATTRNQVQISGAVGTDNASVTLASSKYNTIAASDKLTMAVKPDGTVWQMGRDNMGYVRTTPVQVAGVTGVVSIASGYLHSVALKSDGTVWVWGQNSSGQFGNGAASGSSATAVQVNTLTNIVAISATNSNHTLALKSDGSVWAWGNNSWGQVGDGSSANNRTMPYQIPGLSGVVAIATDADHSLAVKSDGTVWTWGANNNYQLCDGTNIQRNSPVQIPNFTGVVAIQRYLALKGDGTLWTWDYSNRVPIQVAGITDVKAISSGGATMAIKSDGTLWVWGSNIFGGLGNGTTTSSSTPIQVTQLSGVTAVAAGSYHSVALTGSSLWFWGWNYNGQVADGTTDYENRLVPVHSSTITAVKAPVVYATSGTITNLKANAGAQVTSWGALYWNGSAPLNTTIKFRTRGANTEAGLGSATWSGYYLTSGAAITTASSQWLETELTLQTADSTVTPTLNDCSVTYTP